MITCRCEAGRDRYSTECGCYRPTQSHLNRLHNFTLWDAKRSSRFRGVHRVGASPVRWRVSITDSRANCGRPTRLGTFRDQRTAALTYDLALIALGHRPVNLSLSFYASAPREHVLGPLTRVSEKLTGQPFPNRYSCHELRSLAQPHSAT